MTRRVCEVCSGTGTVVMPPRPSDPNSSAASVEYSVTCPNCHGERFIGEPDVTFDKEKHGT